MKMLHVNALLLLITLSLVGCNGGGGASSAGATNSSTSDEPTSTQTSTTSSSNKVLLFVAYNNVWWAEYKVLYEALIAKGYEVEVVSSDTGYATSYQSDTDVENSADSVGGSSYAAFQTIFEDQFGTAWNGSWNTPANITVTKKIQDISSMDDYIALVSAGGTGAALYAYDGSYSASSQTGGGHTSSAANVQAAAEKFNDLVNEAIAAGKPVLTQCHGAKLAGFVRIPGTTGSGFDGLGTSILEGQSATGFHLDSDASTDYASLNVSYKINRRVVVAGLDLTNFPKGTSKVITSRDWYPQTVAAAAKTVINILETYPTETNMNKSISALIVHGGAVDQSNCTYRNKTTNDVPCNFGSNWPADYTDLQTLLSADSTGDSFNISVSEVNILPATGSITFDRNSESEVLSFLNNYDVVIYYKHWNTGMTTAIENALVQYVDSGKGLVSIHHGAYNDNNSKDIIGAAVGVESSSSGWGNRSPYGGTYELMNVNQGHFISSYSMNYNDNVASAALPATPLEPNKRSWGYPSLSMVDEIYTNTAFLGTPTYGTGVNEIQLLFANDYTTASGQTKTSGIAKRYDSSLDGTVGRIVYLQPGEVKANYLVNSEFGQVIRNAVVWTANE